MVLYEVETIGYRNINVTKNEAMIGELIYPKWYSYRAEIFLSDYSKYEVASKNIWRSTMELRDYDNVLLTFKKSRKGRIVIETMFDGNSRRYLLKTKGFGRNFFLLDMHGNELLKASLKMRKFKYKYTIQTSEMFEEVYRKDLLLMTSLYCINYVLSSGGV